MVFNNYDKDISESKIENDGHAIKMTPKPQSFSSTNQYECHFGSEKSLCRTLEINNAISLRHFIGFKLRFILAMKLRSQFGIINHP